VPERATAAAAIRRWRYPLLFAAGALLSALTILNGINPHDEGLVLQAGARVAAGELPYRDFYANYGPGQYYLVGGLDLAFGPSLLAWRIVRVALDALVATFAYALVRRDAPAPFALLAWAAALGVMAHPTIPHPNATALALGLGAILVARRYPVGAGVLAGTAFAFRFDVGAAAAIGAALAAATVREPAGPTRHAAGTTRDAAGRPRDAASGPGARALRAALAAAATAALLLLPLVVADPGELWRGTIGFALDEQSLQRLPLPGAYEGGFEPNKLLAFYMPYVLMGGLALWAAFALARRLPLGAWTVLPLALAGLAYLLARADEFHLVPLAVAVPVLLGIAAGATGVTAWRLALALPMALIALYGLDQNRIDLLDSPPLDAIDVDAADGVRAPPAEARALERVVAYTRERVEPGAPIFVANPRHDLVRVGNPLVYVLADRPNPTRYDVMQPGVVTTAEVQREMVRSLESSGTELVIRWLSPVASEPEPNGAGRSSGVTILDRYLARRYEEVARFGDYALLRRSGPRPE
jgi:hypothetical protein